MYLLDTNVIINIFCQPKVLSIKVSDIILNEDILFVRSVSFWEIAIKQSINKLHINATIPQIEQLCKKNNITTLNFTTNDLENIKSLEKIHNDPFDRLIISQAITNDFTIITCDKKFAKYNIKVLEY